MTTAEAAEALFPDPAMRRDPVFLAAVYAAAYAVQHDNDLTPDRPATTAASFQVVDGQEVDHCGMPDAAAAADSLVRRFRAMPFDSDDDRRGVMQAVIHVVDELLRALGYTAEIGRVQ